MTFWLVRTIVWFLTSIPRALYHAVVSWEGVTGAVASLALTKLPDNRPDMGFKDYFVLYVIGFTLLDICARDYIIAPIVIVGAFIRRGLRALLRFVLMTSAALTPIRAGERALHRLAKLLGLIDQIPRRHRVLRFKTPAPLVPPVKRKKAEDPELLRALKAAEIFARESKTHAEEIEGKLEAMEEKLRTFTQLSEAQISAAKEISERASSAVETVLEEATTRLATASTAATAATEAAAKATAAAAAASEVPRMVSSGMVDDASSDTTRSHFQPMDSLVLVDERIDKRFEDMEAMLRAARDEGRAEGVRESSKMMTTNEWSDEGDGDLLMTVGRSSFDRLDVNMNAAEEEQGRMQSDKAVMAQALKEGMERGIMKGIALEKMRKKQKSWKPTIKKFFGMGESSSRKATAKERLEDLKMAVREGSLEIPKQTEMFMVNDPRSHAQEKEEQVRKPRLK